MPRTPRKINRERIKVYLKISNLGFIAGGTSAGKMGVGEDGGGEVVGGTIGVGGGGGLASVEVSLA